jgi:hypothetical protein
MTRYRRSARLRQAGTLAAVVALAACSSGGSSAKDNPRSTTTTAPPASTTTSTTQPLAVAKPKVTAFLAGEGARLLEFQRVTASMNDGKEPDRAFCRQLVTQTLPKLSASPQGLLDLAKKIPDPRLADLVHTDIFYKNLELNICMTSQPIPEPGRKYLVQVGTDLRARLADFGITI